MIKLTTTINGEKLEKNFVKKEIFIGSKKSNKADFTLPKDSLYSFHVKIIKIHQKYFVINLVNDPFVALNDAPFGKSPIHSGDRLLIGDFEILFEVDDPAQNKAENQETEPQQELSFEELTINNQTEKENFNSPLYSKGKSDSTSDSDSNLASELLINQPKWKQFFYGFLLIFFLFSSIGSGFYLAYRKYNDEYALKAAKEMSDISMALLYAKMFTPPKGQQSWSDSSFLKTTITKVLPDKTPPFFQLTPQGHFKKIPYILRVYVSQIDNRFIAIAQPDPSLLQSLFPKPAIVVDSKSMILKKTYNIQAINRMLLNHEILDQEYDNNISHFLEKATTISLDDLSKKTLIADLQPPQEIHFIDTKASLFIYNAPRYHRMGEKVIQKAQILANGKGSADDQKELIKLVHLFKNLPSFIFYSPEGIEAALLAEKGLKEFSDQEEFLVAFFSNKTHEREQTHLLVAGKKLIQEHANTCQEDLIDEETLIAANDDLVFSLEDEEKTEKDKQFSSLYSELLALASSRTKTLEPYADAIIQLLRINNSRPNKEFFETLDHQINQYLKIESQENEKLKKSLEKLYDYYVLHKKELTDSDFEGLIKKAELQNIR